MYCRNAVCVYHERLADCLTCREGYSNSGLKLCKCAILVLFSPDQPIAHMSFLVSIFKPLAYISLPIILVRSIAATSQVGRYYTRMVLYIGALVTVGSCGIVIAAGMSLIGRSTDANNIVAKMFYATVGRALDLKVEVEGEKHLNTRPAVFMVNHQSILDILVIGR